VNARDLYDALAPIYDAWQSADSATPFGVLAHARLEAALASRGGAGVASFLDLGCATGELLLALGRDHPGWRLAGVDRSAAMLAAAAAKPGARRVTWVRAELERALPFGRPFDAAGAFYDTLNHLPDAGALARAFGAAAGALRPGGLLVFDVTNALGFDRWWHGRNRWRGPGWEVAVATSYDPAAGVGRARVRVERGSETRVLELDERLFSDQEIRGAAASAGLVVESSEPWSPFSIDAPGKTLWIARNRP
jgi:SAM-dependent methyltransferase